MSVRLRLWGHRRQGSGSLSLARDPEEIAAIVGLAALVGFAVYQVHSFWSNGFDDAFITYRYADNLRAGNGLVFNPGERVEGTSTFLFTIMLSVVMAFGGRTPSVGAHLRCRIVLPAGGRDPRARAAASAPDLDAGSCHSARRRWSLPRRRSPSTRPADWRRISSRSCSRGPSCCRSRRRADGRFPGDWWPWRGPRAVAFAALCIGIEWVCDLVEERSLVRASRERGRSSPPIPGGLRPGAHLSRRLLRRAATQLCHRQRWIPRRPIAAPLSRRG